MGAGDGAGGSAGVADLVRRPAGVCAGGPTGVSIVSRCSSTVSCWYPAALQQCFGGVTHRHTDTGTDTDTNTDAHTHTDPDTDTDT